MVRIPVVSPSVRALRFERCGGGVVVRGRPVRIWRRAVRQSKVFVMNDDLVNLSGPVTVEGVWKSPKVLLPKISGEVEVTGGQ